MDSYTKLVAPTEAESWGSEHYQEPVHGDPYRSTPLEIGSTPSELLMERKLVKSTNFQPRIPELATLKIRDDNVKKRQKTNFDSHHGTRTYQHWIQVIP